MQAFVLIVEDRPAHAKLLTEMLKASGHQSLVALTGRNGLALARIIRPSLIVVDIRLPDLDGRQVIARLRAHPSTDYIPILAISALGDPSLQEECSDAGADAFLCKPVRLHQFTHAVAQLLDTIERRTFGFDGGLSQFG